MIHGWEFLESHNHDDGKYIKTDYMELGILFIFLYFYVFVITVWLECD